MKQTSENIIVQLASPERKFVKVYHDFLQNELLTAEEKIIFIALKSFVDFTKDNGGTQGEAYPTMETLCKLSSLSRPRATRTIKKLIEKKIVKKIRRGLTKSNVYILSDYATMWACDNVEDMSAIADNQGIKPLTPAEHIEALEKMGYTVQIKEKGLENEPSKGYKVTKKELVSTGESNETSSTQILSNYNIQHQKGQPISVDMIKKQVGYDEILLSSDVDQKDLDAAVNIIHEAVTTTKESIRVGGEDKPAQVIYSRLIKLNREDIIYVLKKLEDVERGGKMIKNHEAYLLTQLYKAKDQRHLEYNNLGHVNGDF